MEVQPWAQEEPSRKAPGGDQTGVGLGGVEGEERSQVAWGLVREHVLPIRKAFSQYTC